MNLLARATKLLDGARILHDWVGSGGEVVDQALAQKRADTCIDCPSNLAGWKVPEKIAEAIKEQVALKNDMALAVKSEWRLHTCNVCLCPTKTKLWVPLAQLTKYMTKADFETYPTNCYIRTESNL